MIAFQHTLPKPNDRVFIIPIGENGTVKKCRRDERQEIIIDVIRDSDEQIHLCREFEIGPERALCKEPTCEER